MAWRSAASFLDTSCHATAQWKLVTRRFLRSFACAIILLLPGACLGVHTTHNVPPASVLPWLPAEQSSPAEIVRVLGPAHASLESGRILLWQLNEDGQVDRDRDWIQRTYGEALTGPLQLVVVLDRPELELAKIERIRLVRTEAPR